MLVLRNPADTYRIAHPGIRGLVEQRFTEILAGEVYDYDQHGYMVVVEPGDTFESLEKETLCPIHRNIFDEATYGNPDFSPSFEALEEHDDCYEMLFINNDNGFGITLFVPKTETIERNLLALCAEYAKPAIRPQ